jgi:branched-chain amino acid transport system ATP-binding protein
MTVLQVQGLHAGYSAEAVVRDATFDVPAGEVVTLLGANGAGKTTTLATIAGLIPPISGRISFLGQDLRNSPTHRRVREGLALVPEGRALFHSLSVRDNMRLVGGADKVAEVVDLLPELGPLLSRRAGVLSGGEQQMLGIGRALVSGPKLLMIDEMSLGLAPVIVERLLPLVRRIAHERSVAVLLVEQHVALALDVADRAMVMSHGQIVLTGSAADVAARTEFLESSYLGEQVL